MPGRPGVAQVVQGVGGRSADHGRAVSRCRSWGPTLPADARARRPGPPWWDGRSSRPWSGCGTPGTPRPRSIPDSPGRRPRRLLEALRPAGRGRPGRPAPGPRRRAAGRAGRRPGRGDLGLDRRPPGRGADPRRGRAASARATSRPAGRRPGPAHLAGLPAPGPRRRPVGGHPGPATGTPVGRGPGFDAAPVARPGPAPGRHPCRPGGHGPAAGSTPGCSPPVLLGGSAAPAGLPANVVTTYGMTETGSGVVYDGRPLDGVEVAVGTGQPGQRGGRRDPGAGARCCCGPTATAPTRRSPGPTGPAAGCPPATAAGSTTDGRLTRGRPPGRGGRDRRREGVAGARSSGCWPAQPAVAEVAVWKRPDPEWGERVVAWVVPADPAAPPSLAELRAGRRGRAGPVGRPQGAGARRGPAPHRLGQGPPGRARCDRSARAPTRPGREVRRPPRRPGLPWPRRRPPGCWPVIHEAASETRNRAAVAMSSGSPRRCRGSRPSHLLLVVLPELAGEVGLDQAGGQALTRTAGAQLQASWRVRWATAALVTLYQPMPGSGSRPPTEATLRMVPPCSAIQAR